MLMAVPEMRCSARPFAESTTAPPSGRSRRTRLRRPRSASSPSAHQGFSAGGSPASVPPPPSSPILRTPPATVRGYLGGVSPPPQPMTQRTVIRDFDRYLPCNDLDASESCCRFVVFGFLSEESPVPKLRVHGFTISLDGYGAGPNQDLN